MSLRERLDSDRPVIDPHVSDTHENYYGFVLLATLLLLNIANSESSGNLRPRGGCPERGVACFKLAVRRRECRLSHQQPAKRPDVAQRLEALDGFARAFGRVAVEDLARAIAEFTSELFETHGYLGAAFSVLFF